MENVVDALYMGFAALAFTLALSISIGAFTQVTQVSNYIVESKDQETLYTYVDYQGDNTARIVGEETIIPTLYRAYEENYIVRFFKAEGNNRKPIEFLEVKRDAAWIPTNQINLRQMTLGTPEEAVEFVNQLIQGNLDSKFDNRIRLKVANERTL